MRPACREEVPRLTPKVFLTLDARCEYNHIKQIVKKLKEVFAVQRLKSMPPQTPLSPIFYKILVIMDIDKNALYDFL